MPDSTSLNGKFHLVTGASSGTGFSIAEKLLGRGTHVAVQIFMLE